MDWIDSYRRVTSRLESYVEDLFSRTPVKDACVHNGNEWDTVEIFISVYLGNHDLNRIPDTGNLFILGIDGLAI